MEGHVNTPKGLNGVVLAHVCMTSYLSVVLVVY